MIRILLFLLLSIAVSDQAQSQYLTQIMTHTDEDGKLYSDPIHAHVTLSGENYAGLDIYINGRFEFFVSTSTVQFSNEGDLYVGYDYSILIDSYGIKAVKFWYLDRWHYGQR